MQALGDPLRNVCQHTCSDLRAVAADLEIRAVFPDGTAVKITQYSELIGDDRRRGCLGCRRRIRAVFRYGRKFRFANENDWGGGTTRMCWRAWMP